MERLQKVIAASGYTSRRKAEELIKNGKVYVNGEIVKELGTKVRGNDDIVVNGVHLSREENVYFILNKPRSVICSVNDDKGRVTVVDLIKTDKRIYPVGRLDYDTTGLTESIQAHIDSLQPKTEVKKEVETNAKKYSVKTQE